jgi:preprotein translocase subunit SecG
MQTLITVVHVVTCVLLVLVVLVQSGKGAEISASFSGSSQTVFGSSGGQNFFTQFTQGAAALFFVTSIVLTILGGQTRKSLFETGTPSAAQTQATAPATGNPTTPDAPAKPADVPAGAAAPAAAVPATSSAPATTPAH